jgi:hypothetical protein
MGFYSRKFGERRDKKVDVVLSGDESFRSQIKPLGQ